MKTLISLTPAQLDKVSRRRKKTFTRQFTLFLVNYSKESKNNHRMNFTQTVNWFKGRL